MKASGLKPAMFIQWAYEESDGSSGDERLSVLGAARIRIVYPSGRIEWCSLDNISSSMKFVFKKPPCYLYHHGKLYHEKTFNRALCAITDYDNHMGFSPMKFICEL